MYSPAEIPFFNSNGLQSSFNGFVASIITLSSNNFSNFFRDSSTTLKGIARIIIFDSLIASSIFFTLKSFVLFSFLIPIVTSYLFFSQIKLKISIFLC